MSMPMTTPDMQRAMRVADAALLSLALAVNQLRRATAEADTDGVLRELFMRIELAGPIHHGEMRVGVQTGDYEYAMHTPATGAVSSSFEEFLRRKEFSAKHAILSLSYVPDRPAVADGRETPGVLHRAGPMIDAHDPDKPIY